MMPLIAFALTALTLAQSPSTMAAVAVFSANAERKWPADDREPAVTNEALRLLEAAAKAVADDRKINTGKVQGALSDFTSARTALERQPADAEDASPAREALIKGRELIDAVASALRLNDSTTKQRLSELKRTADSLDRKKPVRQQAEVLEKYFHQADELLRAILAAPGAEE